MSQERATGDPRAMGTYRARKAENRNLNLLRRGVLTGARVRSADVPRLIGAWVVTGANNLRLFRRPTLRFFVPDVWVSLVLFRYPPIAAPASVIDGLCGRLRPCVSIVIVIGGGWVQGLGAKNGDGRRANCMRVF